MLATDCLLPTACGQQGAFIVGMESVFAELKRMDEGAAWDDPAFSNGADTLAHVLELVRQHKVGACLQEAPSGLAWRAAGRAALTAWRRCGLRDDGR